MSSVQPPISPLRVVSDSSPFIALNAIGRLDLLRHLFDVVVVPRAVEKEVKSLSLPLWVTVMDLPAAAPFFEAGIGLGPGETETIRLALHLGPAWLLLPDWLLLNAGAGRRAAQRLGLRITGVLGILLAAGRSGILGDIQPELDLLMANGFRIAPRLYQQLLAASHKA